MQVAVPPSLNFEKGAYLRLRVAVGYPQSEDKNGNNPDSVIQWFWKGSSDAWNESRSIRLPAAHGSEVVTYWAALPVSSLGSGLSALRLDPGNRKTPIEIKWIEIDVVD